MGDLTDDVVFFTFVTARDVRAWTESHRVLPVPIVVLLGRRVRAGELFVVGRDERDVRPKLRVLADVTQRVQHGGVRTELRGAKS